MTLRIAYDAEAVRGFCAEQIAQFKVPQHIRFVSEFPMTITGKIQKFLMRERMIEELNLNLEPRAT
jgi:fatty-acyl-CoA synthase